MGHQFLVDSDCAEMMKNVTAGDSRFGFTLCREASIPYAMGLAIMLEGYVACNRLD